MVRIFFKLLKHRKMHIHGKIPVRTRIKPFGNLVWFIVCIRLMGAVLSFPNLFQPRRYGDYSYFKGRGGGPDGKSSANRSDIRPFRGNAGDQAENR
jgi:hypothetical protein